MKTKTTLLIALLSLSSLVAGCATHTPPPPCDDYDYSAHTVGNPNVYVASNRDCGPARPINFRTAKAQSDRSNSRY